MSVAGLAEVAVWLAGSNYQLAALGEASALWPVILVLPSGGCAH
jgi:hypothetical protein